MKRLYIILILVAGAFVFFSFLSKTDQEKDESLVIFFDKNLPDKTIISQEIITRLENEGFSVSSHYFNTDDISRIIMSHPDALFITNEPLKLKLYSMEKFDLFLVKAAVIRNSIEVGSINGRRFDVAALKGMDASFKVISYEDLDLGMKLLPVDGIFPSLYNVKYGNYPKVYRAHIYYKDNDILKKKRYHDLRYHLGNWIDRSFSIVAGGDIMLARGSKIYIDKFGYRYPFVEIEKYIDECDIAVANLESPLSNRGTPFTPFKGIYFRADPGVVDGLKFSGFDVLTLANNHALDYGIEAISETMALLKENGIMYTGVGRSRNEALSPAVVRIQGTDIAFISYNAIYPFSVNESGQTMQTLAIRGDSLSNDIESLKERYDVVIVSVHTGVEYLRHPEQDKVMLMRKLVDCGADVVLGSHPHVIQDIEVYRGGIIAYSLGNLIFDQNWSKETSLGLLLEIAFIGGSPVYYHPKIIGIRKAQARVLENESLESVFTQLDSERSEYAYKQN